MKFSGLNIDKVIIIETTQRQHTGLLKKKKADSISLRNRKNHVLRINKTIYFTSLELENQIKFG